MAPNWKKFQRITKNMIEEMLGGIDCTLTTPGAMTYNMKTGESSSTEVISHVKLALIETNKDDLKDLPEGYRDRKIMKIYTVEPIKGSPTITTDFNGLKYEIIVPSVEFTAGGMVHCYRTFIAKIETENYPIDEDVI